MSSVLPHVKELISSAPQAGSGAKLVSGLLGAIGGDKAKGLSDLAGLAGGFANLKLDNQMVGRFIPIVLDFAKNKGGQEILGLLTKVLQK